jgi:hypothetical protein
MAEARQRHDWSIASSVMALLASVHRDPKKRRAFKPSDFDPFARTADAGQPIPADVRVLKDVFVRKNAQQQNTEDNTGQGGSHEG